MHAILTYLLHIRLAIIVFIMAASFVGFLYFLATGFRELYDHRRAVKRQRESRAFRAGAILSLLLAVFVLASCTSAQFTTDAQALAKAAQVAAPSVGNKTLSDYLYGLGAVATAYGSAPMPTNIIQATAPIPGLAGVVLPLITGKNNGPKTQALINGAAAILAGFAPAATTGT
jgi:uncharacterized integral membrane protein